MPATNTTPRNADELKADLLGAFGETAGDLKEGDALKLIISEVKPAAQPNGGTDGALSLADDASAVAPLKFDDRNVNINDGARFMNDLAALLVNCDENLSLSRGADLDPLHVFASYSNVVEAIALVAQKVDEKLGKHLDDVFHDDDFQAIEAVWRGLHHLASGVESEDVIIDFLDGSKDEIGADVIDHDTDIFGGSLFNKVYIQEYDRYGGKPFATMIGLYEFESTDEDIDWLRAMGRVANASHCPFVASVAPTFFTPCKTMQEVAEIGDLDAVLTHPHFGKYNELRDTDYAAYLGLVLPRYLLRRPFGHAYKLEPGNVVGYKETVQPGRTDDDSHFLWGNAAILFAKNMVRSFEGSGWAQHIRGPRGGGIVEGLTVFTYEKNGYEHQQPPVEIAIPDYRELQFASNGFIPLVHKKNEAVATFFSAQSLKKPRTFVEDLNTKNAHLVTNLAYSFSITRIAHFVKRMMREYIGSTADGPYIQQVLANWLGGYVTTVVNPDDLTLRFYPFKAVSVTVEDKPGAFGWYKSVISVLPHAQFEGMDVELRLEAALGGP
ncbi:type VI secretion system contractile sheath large subunit [Polyangium sp. 6x1]|uniref:type VI secretion system contractile sheath large subunit n=1 Tax=Polyangium sp. 6x1 TaxID=3042689 RepID=UPI0024823745|nr:type VI secretion system contractile sheath large subunit [Polyangium sp. 6x1]MDI1448130.1 type VI secretion system contractile sheath large subunit [Polyangium sp. 6x1]